VRIRVRGVLSTLAALGLSLVLASSVLAGGCLDYGTKSCPNGRIVQIQTRATGDITNYWNGGSQFSPAYLFYYHIDASNTQENTTFARADYQFEIDLSQSYTWCNA
jgi:hypothetical protein